MKKITILLSLFCLATLSASAQTDISLDGEWKFHIPNIKSEETVIVPHTYNVMEGLEDYAGMAVYRRNIPSLGNMRGKQVRLHFNGVYHDAVVRINGKEAGRHLNAGYTAFSMDITPYLDKEHRKNVIEVECNNNYTEKNLPWKRSFDWANDGGIYRSVRLHITGKQSVRYLHVTPKLNLADSTATAHIALRLYEDNVRTATFNLKIKENGSGKYIHNENYKLGASKDRTFQTTIQCGKVNLWHFDQPNLYSYEITLYDGNEVSDFKRENFGFREVNLSGNRLLLNGEVVRLPGIEDMPGSNPYIGMAESKKEMEKSCWLMKDANATITRYHWVQDDYRLQLLDSLGMLVQEEVSWWQRPREELGPELMATAKQQLKEMIESHYNHPCIWAWGISNEVGDNRKDLLELKSYAQTLDPTRHYMSISNYIFKHLKEDPSLVLDLPTWNEYIGTWHGNHRNDLKMYIEKVNDAIGERPLFITEAGLCEPANTGGDARRVDDMIFHLEEWKRFPNVMGYIYFCLNDYRTQMGEEGIGRHRIRRHGVVNKYGEPKPSYYVLQSLMCPIEVIGVKEKYHVDISLTIRNRNTIPSYTLRGYRIVFEDDKGKVCTINLPDMKPGDVVKNTLYNINHEYKFRIERSNGTVVLNY